MDDILIEGTERAPKVAFEFSANKFAISGESYPEDVTAFYGELIGNLEAHFDSLEGQSVTFSFELIYFNSSTAKVMMRLFEMLDECAENNDVSIVWKYEEDDDNMQELGEEFSEDLENASFKLEEIPIS